MCNLINTHTHTCREAKQNKDKIHDEPDYSSISYIGSRIGWVSALLYYITTLLAIMLKFPDILTQDYYT